MCCGAGSAIPKCALTSVHCVRNFETVQLTVYRTCLFHSVMHNCVENCYATMNRSATLCSFLRRPIKSISCLRGGEACLRLCDTMTTLFGDEVNGNQAVGHQDE